jgi:hypothetical protein
MQKRFVKKWNWNFGNLEKYIILRSGVINVTLCSLLIKRRLISFNCIIYSIFSNTLQLFKCQQQQAFKLTPATWALRHFKMSHDKG